MLRLSYSTLTLVVFALASVTGCNQKAQAGGPDQSHAAPSASAPAKRAAARLVFLDKETACDCTKAKIDSSWSAIQAALGSGNPMPVERIHADTEADKAAPLIAKRKIVSLPALYVLDDSGNVLDLFQGEMEENAVRRSLR